MKKLLLLAIVAVVVFYFNRQPAEIPQEVGEPAADRPPGRH